MLKVKAPTSKFSKALTLLAGHSSAKDTLFVPLKIVASSYQKADGTQDGKLSTSSSSQGKTAFVLGEVYGFDVEGEGCVVLDKAGPDKILSILALFPADEKIAFIVDSGVLTIKGARDEVKMRMLDEEHVKDYFWEKLPFAVKDGVAIFKDKKPTMHFKVASTELQRLVERSTLAGVDYYKFKFDGTTRVSMGDLSNPASTPVETDLVGTFEGQGASVIYGHHFGVVASIVDGDWDLWTMDQSPMWMTRKCEEYKIAYFLAPKVEA